MATLHANTSPARSKRYASGSKITHKIVPGSLKERFRSKKRKTRRTTWNIVWKIRNTIPLQIAVRLFVKIGVIRFTIKLVSAGPTNTAAPAMGNKSTSKAAMR
jgi:hypothetical protein